MSQEFKADAGKLRLTLVPLGIIRAIAKVRMYGVAKYGEHGASQWHQIADTKEETIQRYKDAAFRHFLLFLEAPTGRDEESGLPHIWHLATNIAFLIELIKEDTDV